MTVPGTHIQVSINDNIEKSFIPNPLPPDTLDYNNQLIIRLNTEASQLIGKLSAIGSHFKSPNIYIASYIKNEAIYSSQIEGTFVEYDDLVLFEQNPMKKHSLPSDTNEVYNYIKALEHGIKSLDRLPISSRLIKEIHKILMTDIKESRGRDTNPGEYRAVQNWVGSKNDIVYVPPPANKILECLSDLEKYINLENANEPPLIQCALIHYQFEAIHPFIDGNGRVGRILILLFLIFKKLLYHPILNISDYFEKTKDEYYLRLANVSKKGAWTEWISYFLQGVIDSAKESLILIENLMNCHNKYTEILNQTKYLPKSSYLILDELFISPIVQPMYLSEKLGVPYNSIKRAIGKLKDIGILREYNNKKRNKLYIADEIYQLLVTQPGK